MPPSGGWLSGAFKSLDVAVAGRLLPLPDPIHHWKPHQEIGDKSVTEGMRRIAQTTRKA